MLMIWVIGAIVAKFTDDMKIGKGAVSVVEAGRKTLPGCECGQRSGKLNTV